MFSSFVRRQQRIAKRIGAPCRLLSAQTEAAFRRFGHKVADLDPLGLSSPPVSPEIEAAKAAINDAERLAQLERCYTGPLGAEFEHLESSEEREWFAAQIEDLMTSSQLSLAEKRNAWSLMEQAEQFELFLGKKYSSFKRYSGEGTESLLPGQLRGSCSASIISVVEYV